MARRSQLSSSKEYCRMILMTNNQWKYDHNNEKWARLGMDCSADVRSAGLVRAYQQICPDILAVQESSHLMERLIMQSLFEYATPQGERISYKLVTGGDTPIYYRDDKFFPIETGYYLYPEAVPGYEGSFNNARTKSYTFGVFEELSTGKRVIVVSTHLWWKSGNPERFNYQPHSNIARVYQISLAIQKAEELIAKYACPAFIMGDFNAGIDSACMNEVAKLGWTEAHDLCTGERDETKGHHFCVPDGFERGEPGVYHDALDHIIVKNGSAVAIQSYKRLNDAWFDCVSDHYPLYVDIEI